MKYTNTCMLLIILIRLLLGFIPFWCSAKETVVYSSIDKNGIQVFSDYPEQNNSTKVIIKTRAPVISDDNKKRKQYQEQTKPLDRPFNISTAISILSPSSLQNIHAPGPKLPITIANMGLFLKNNYSYAIFIDGIKQQYSIQKNKFYIRTPNNGKHILKVELFSHQGKLLAYSELVTFYIRAFVEKHQSGIQRPTPKLYENQTGKNYQDFQKSHSESLISAPNPYKVDWNDYNRQMQQ